MKKPEIVYGIENFQGELLAHMHDGPLCFPEKADAQEYVDQRERTTGKYQCVAPINVIARKGVAFTDFGVVTEDGLQTPPRGMWLRAFRDMGQQHFDKWCQEMAEPDLMPKATHDLIRYAEHWSVMATEQTDRSQIVDAILDQRVERPGEREQVWLADRDTYNKWQVDKAMAEKRALDRAKMQVAQQNVADPALPIDNVPKQYSPEPEPEPAALPDDLDSLRHLCEVQQIKWHHRHKAQTLKRLLAESSSAAAEQA